MTSCGYVIARENIGLYASGVHDQPSDKTLIAKLSAMNAGM
jgi:hypothetical protein